jgi:hypothetical protein
MKKEHGVEPVKGTQLALFELTRIAAGASAAKQ